MPIPTDLSPSGKWEWKMGMGRWGLFINGDLWHKPATVWSGQTALSGILVLGKQPWGWGCFPAALRGLNSLLREWLEPSSTRIWGRRQK